MEKLLSLKAKEAKVFREWFFVADLNKVKGQFFLNKLQLTDLQVI